MQPFLDSTDYLHDGAELGRRMERDGYLFIRGLLPAGVVEDLRMQILEIASAAGWVLPGRPLGDAV
ncbi:MAG: phytanoyl-CoA dioxygenase, partial [Caldilineaceae bacterium SB0675_bin_29]|nr:phytanoyl-CoA dioxygenase [Caldilineaceae bacterium SB0675_bin_29]